MISDKYVAGFFDSDGSVGLNWCRSKVNTDCFRFTLRITFAQHSLRRSVLEEIQKKFGFGNIQDKDREGLHLVFNSNYALRVAERIHKHCVIKGEYLRNLMHIFQNNNVEYTKQEKDLLMSQLKILRKQKNPRIYNYPSRKWMAGYIDGDGSLYSSWNKQKENMKPMLAAATSTWDTAGVELLQKAYKGSIFYKKGDGVVWQLPLTKENIPILKHLANNLILKKRNAEFIIEILREGKHYRKNGCTTEQGLKYHNYLKSLNTLATTK